MTANDSVYKDAAAYADRIEQELRRINGWQSVLVPDWAYQSERPFLADTMTFYQWLQFVLLPRIRDIVEKQESLKTTSSVGAYAIRELDGLDQAAKLIGVLCDFDAFIEGP